MSIRTIRSKLNCIELFAGAGGLVLGLEMAGFNTIVVNEYHPDPCKTLRRNFPKTPVLQADIKKITGRKLLEFSSSKKISIDLIAGGPPCQGFSNAGLKDPDDPRNTLIGDFIRIVRELKPKYFLMENVEGLITLHGGKLFNRILEQFSATGYSFHYKILYAADYGVPQMRKRLIILGSKYGSPPPFPEPSHIDKNGQLSLFGSKFKPPFITCGEAIGDLPLIKQGETAIKYDKDPITDFQKLMRNKSRIIYNHKASKHREETSQYYGLIPAGGTPLDIPEEQRKKKQGIQRWPLNGLSRTITTEPTDFLHPILDRIPTIRELARIQTFPDKYEFLGQRTTGNKMRRLGYCAQSQQVGNAVPPLLAKAIGEAIKKHAG